MMYVFYRFFLNGTEGSSRIINYIVVGDISLGDCSQGSHRALSDYQGDLGNNRHGNQILHGLSQDLECGWMVE